MRKMLLPATLLVLCLGGLSLTHAQPPLLNDDCAKCHPGAVTDVATRGARHTSSVSCLDCHIEHPPLGSEVIPACSMCHDPGEKEHFALASCSECHYPHYPLEIDFAKVGEVKGVCITCHATQGTELTSFPSKHSALDCKECHNAHAQYLSCNNCHEGHSPEMQYKDCLICHQPHKTTQVLYQENTPSAFCAACHDTVADNLAADTSKHHDLSCSFCHQNEHKMIPACSSCHGTPHGKDMHAKFPNCLDCHSDPHALAR